MTRAGGFNFHIIYERMQLNAHSADALYSYGRRYYAVDQFSPSSTAAIRRKCTTYTRLARMRGIPIFFRFTTYIYVCCLCMGL